MAIEKSALRVTELDFNSIRENLKTFLRSQPEFTDYDFEGSGMSVLLDILAYNTHYMGFYMNMVGNEMFLDSAQLRSSIISHAKLMNYVPGSNEGALAKINVQVTPQGTVEDQTTNSLTLDKYTRLIGTDVDGINYPFVTLNSNTAAKLSGSFSFSNVMIKQGEVITRQFAVDESNPTRRFEIPSSNVDISTISVVVQESASNTDAKSYFLAEDITELTGSSLAYFLEENENLTYTLYFGDDIIGKRPKNGNIVITSYLDNVGQVSNNISRFVFTDDIGGKFSNNVRVTSTSGSYGGIDKESVEQVRFRAPYFYSTQNRAVTKDDYSSLLLKDYNFLESVSVWGGEENEPIVYGKVFISLKTKGNYTLTNFEKEQIKNDLIKKRNVVTVIPEIVEPDFVYLIIEGKVFYDPKLTSLSATEINALVKAAIQDYSEIELNRFDAVFRKSKLQHYIENAEASITGSDIKVFIQKRTKVDTIFRRNYNIPFGTELEHTSANKLSTFPAVVVFDNANIAREAFFEEVPAADTGVSSVQVTNGGRNYTVSPSVTILGDGSGATAIARILSGRVVAVEVTNPGKNYSYAIAAITGGDGAGAAAETVKLQTEVGKLRTFYYKEDGEKVIIDSNAGSLDHTTGLVKINSIKIFETIENDFYDSDILTIIAMSKDANIYPSQNRILTIDDSDPRSIQIETVVG